ncbi:LysR family transcriptional regulator [Tsuneonella flava]|uniref:LysR family transcriptional regulator n=1 Tax=Tsuneonella flava TaxID=2055955 RepID=A0ABX7KD79_9SPHN|nr:LysR family transcriptional regulator [Tsuneonella flava]
MDLVTLRVFLSIVSEGSLVRAAERENIALSAVSRRISEMEARTGVVLFDRRDRGMKLTSAGHALAEHVVTIFAELQSLARDLDAQRGGESGYVRLCHMWAASSMLGTMLADFLEANPGVDVRVDECTLDETLNAVRIGEADVGVITSFASPLPEKLELIPWREDELRVILPRGHVLCEKSALSLADICEHPIVAMRCANNFHDLLDEQARKHGVVLNERVHTNSYENARAMVAAGLGVALVPSSYAWPYVKELKIEVRALSEDWARRRLMICVRRNEKLTAAGQLLIDHLLESTLRRSAA